MPGKCGMKGKMMLRKSIVVLFTLVILLVSATPAFASDYTTVEICNYIETSDGWRSLNWMLFEVVDEREDGYQYNRRWYNAVGNNCIDILVHETDYTLITRVQEACYWTPGFNYEVSGFNETERLEWLLCPTYLPMSFN
jgi:hypothetical protein